MFYFLNTENNLITIEKLKNSKWMFNQIVNMVHVIKTIQKIVVIEKVKCTIEESFPSCLKHVDPHTNTQQKRRASEQDRWQEDTCYCISLRI